MSDGAGSVGANHEAVLSEGESSQGLVQVRVLCGLRSMA
jgi:hypothetical protein